VPGKGSALGPAQPGEGVQKKIAPFFRRGKILVSGDKNTAAGTGQTTYEKSQGKKDAQLVNLKEGGEGGWGIK